VCVFPEENIQEQPSSSLKSHSIHTKTTTEKVPRLPKHTKTKSEEHQHLVSFKPSQQGFCKLTEISETRFPKQKGKGNALVVITLCYACSPPCRGFTLVEAPLYL